MSRKTPPVKKEPAQLPVLKYSVEPKITVTMGPEGFKLEWEDDMQINLASLLIAGKVMQRVKQTYEHHKANSKDKEVRKILQDRLPRVAHACLEISKACQEMYTMIAAQQIKMEAEKKKEEQSAGSLKIEKDGRKPE